MRRLVLILYVSLAGAACAVPLGLLKTASFIINAVDEENRPVSNALVRVDFFHGYESGWDLKFSTGEAMTDTNGLCHLEGKCNGTAGGNVTKEGFYKSYPPSLSVTNCTLTHWLPIDKEYQVVLRPILNPIPMYAKKLHGILIPAIGERLSYDFESADWLPPHGDGKVADLNIRMDCEFGEQLPAGENVREFHATLTLTFSNEDDGIIELPDAQPELEGSVFRLPRFAPETGYSNRWSLYGFETATESSYSDNAKRANLNYFYRVRTKKDETGRIISAHYGKIRGPINFGAYAKATSLSMTYYFNSTPNDRNMEFDPSRNLFTDLPVSDQVREP